MTLNQYKVRHIRRLKTEISTKLKENEKEGKYVNEAVDNYFEKNTIGQISGILREKYNLF